MTSRDNQFILRLVPRAVMMVMVCCLAATTSRAQSTPPSQGGLIIGVVKSGESPLPGATVTATNTLTGQKIVVWTDVDGTYQLQAPADGRYIVRAQMAAFAASTNEVMIGATNRTERVDLDLTLLSRAQTKPDQETRQAPAMLSQGFHSLSVTGGEGLGDISADDQSAASQLLGQGTSTATESVAVTGTTSNPTSTFSPDEIRQRMEQGRDQASRLYGGGGFGPGGFGGGGPVLFGGSGGRRGRFDINRPHGTIYYSVGDSALDASPYSLTGQPVSKPGYVQNRYGAAIGGPLNIPGIYHGGDKTFFFVHYNGTHSTTPFDAFSTVPTLLERQGNFSQTVITSGPNAGQPVIVFDPATGIPFGNDTIPVINSASQFLLPFIPLPNLPRSVQNFHFITSVSNSSNDLNLRLNRSLGGASSGSHRRGPRNNLSFGFHYHTSDNVLTNSFPSVGGNTSVRSFDIPIGYTRTFGKLINSLRFDFNRNRISTRNLYAFSDDITGEAGINSVSTNPFDWGLPNLSFTNFGSVQDTNPLLLRDQTYSISDSMIWQHGKHTWRWGGDFRWIQHNTETDSNARGSFTFTGVNSGFDFADFLLGLPQLTSVQFGENNYHFRGNSWDLFVQDEWRLRGNLTFNLGLRYEYFSPYTELDNRIVNLDVASGFTAVAPVQPGQAGPYSGVFPASLVNPDRNNFAPRMGIAWKALPKTVIRAGYGLNYNTSAYSNIVQQLAFQPPFSFTQTNVQSPTSPLTLQNGFPAPTQSVTNNYGVDRNYRLGYVQLWNLNVQQEITPTLILNLDYTGTKGTGLDIIEAPNRTASGVRIPGVQPFNWGTSQGDSILHAGSVRLRKRLQRGFSIGGTYRYSKSIDNASTIGGGAVVVAQDAFDLAAERGLSSFDQRHQFTADYLWELPFGQGKRWLAQGGVLQKILGDWQWSGDWTIASGLPFTPRVLGDPTDVNRGTNGTLRADVTGQAVQLSNPTVGEFFNTAAFVAPPAGNFGDARRNSIEGPHTILFDMSLTKVFTLKEAQSLEFRVQASNIFNTPQFTSINTIVNSPTYGQVINVGDMRTIQFSARFRF